LDRSLDAGGENDLLGMTLVDTTAQRFNTLRAALVYFR
jgi:hypothetical protein